MPKKGGNTHTHTHTHTYIHTHIHEQRIGCREICVHVLRQKDVGNEQVARLERQLGCFLPSVCDVWMCRIAEAVIYFVACFRLEYQCAKIWKRTDRW